MTAVISPAPRAEWQELWAADREAVLCQAPRWTEVLGAFGYADASRLYDLGGGRRFVLPLVRRGLAVASLPDAWGMGGLVGPEPPTEADVARVGADLARLPVLRASVRPHPLQAPVWRRAGGLAVERRAHVLDLSGGPEVVFTERFAADARRAVRKAERAGVEVRSGTSATILRDYRRLFDLSVARWAERQHEPLALARLRAHRRDPPAKLARLATAFGDRIRLWLAYDGDAPVAGIVVLFGATASYTRGAMDRSRITASSANELLQWHAIQAAAARGCTRYHLGDSGTSASLARFKEKLGARPVAYAERRYERLPLTRADTAARAAVKSVIGFRDG